MKTFLTLVWIGLVFVSAVPAQGAKSAQDWYAKGFEQSLNGQTDRAVQSYRRALKLKPGWAEAHHQLAVLYYRLKDGVRAVHHLRQAERFYLKDGGDQSQKNLAIVRKNLKKAYADFNLSEGDFAEMDALHPPPAGERWQRAGAGFLFGGQGYLLTLNHFVQGAKGLRVRFADGGTAGVKLVKSYLVYDLALLRLDPPPQSPANALEFAGALQVGQPVFAVEYDFEKNAARGVKRGRLLALKAIKKDKNLLESDLPFQKTQLGAPLFDAAGRVAGIQISKTQAMKAFKTHGKMPDGELALNANYIRRVLAHVPGVRLAAKQLKRAAMPSADAAANIEETARRSLLQVEVDR